jgi:hypothetical protein
MMFVNKPQRWVWRRQKKDILAERYLIPTVRWWIFDWAVFLPKALDNLLVSGLLEVVGLESSAEGRGFRTIYSGTETVTPKTPGAYN